MQLMREQQDAREVQCLAPSVRENMVFFLFRSHEGNNLGGFGRQFVVLVVVIVEINVAKIIAIVVRSW